MKRKFSLLLAAILCAGSIYTNGNIVMAKQQDALAVNSIVSEGKTFVPLRSTLSELGFSIDYENTKKQIYVTKKKKSLILSVGSTSAVYKGETVTLAAAPAAINGSVYVPLEVLTDILGYTASVSADGTVSVADEESSSDDSWKENKGTIDLDKLSVTGSGASIDKSTVNITKGGKFSISGSFKGSIVVDTDDKVKLVLNGVNIEAQDGPAIYFKNADKAYVTLESGSQNTLSDSSAYTDEDTKAVLFSNDDLEIKGSGSLKITAAYKHGIASDDVLTIENGNITITSEGDGIHANDGIYISGGSITIDAKADGIQSEGYIEIADGTLNITTTGEVEASQNDDFPGGGFGRGGMAFGNGEMPQGGFGEMQPNGEMPQGGFGGMRPDGEMPQGGFGGMQPNAKTDIQNSETASETDADDSASSKGIKADGNIMILGGSINVNSTDTCIKSDSYISIEGGNIALVSSGKKGIKAVDDLFINGGTIKVDAADEGLESKRIMSINGGDITVNAKDDGLNAGGGSGGMMGNSAEYGEHHIVINGGSLYVDAMGDGIDSNGYLTINGGDVVVYGPTNAGNSALDSNGVITINGGTVLAVGSVGMVEVPSASSEQNVLNMAFDSQQSAGTAFAVTASDSSVIVESTPEKVYQSVIYSSPEISEGETYTLSAGGTAAGSAAVSGKITSIGSNANRGMGGGMQNGFFGRNEGNTQQIQK